MWNSASRRFCAAPAVPWRTAICIRPHDSTLSSRSFSYKRKPAGSKYTRWSEEDLNKVLRLRESGLSAKDIQKQLPGRTIRSIQAQLHRPDRPLRSKLLERGLIQKIFPSIPEDDLRRIQKLREEGVVWREILRQYPHLAIEEIRRKAKPTDHSDTTKPGRGAKYTDQEKTELVRYRSVDGLLWREIQARMPNRSDYSLRTQYYKLTKPDRPRPLPGRRSSLTKEDIAKAVKLRESGMPWSQVVDTIGKTGFEVLRLRYRFEKYLPGEERRRGGWTEAEEQWLAAHVARGPANWMEEAVKKLHRDPIAIRAKMFQLRNKEAQQASTSPDGGR